MFSNYELKRGAESPCDAESDRLPTKGPAHEIRNRQTLHSHWWAHVSLEDAFWRGLKEIAHAQCVTLWKMVAEIDETRQQSNLSSAIRVFELDRLRAPLSTPGASDCV